MSEEQPSLHIDTDWKKQAQEEKRRLAEEQQKRQAHAPAVPPVPPPGLLNPAPAAPAGAGAAGPASAGASGRRGRVREMPQASFPTLVHSLLTQALFYLGDLASSAGGGVDLDRAKLQIDTLGVLEQKTQNNLTEEEKHLLDVALYETRSRFISVASQFI